MRRKREILPHLTPIPHRHRITEDDPIASQTHEREETLDAAAFAPEDFEPAVEVVELPCLDDASFHVCLMFECHIMERGMPCSFTMRHITIVSHAGATTKTRVNFRQFFSVYRVAIEERGNGAEET